MYHRKNHVKNTNNPTPEDQDPTTTITNLLATNPSMSAQLMEFIRNMTAQAQASQDQPSSPNQDSPQDEIPRSPQANPTQTVTPTKETKDDSMDIDQE